MKSKFKKVFVSVISMLLAVVILLTTACTSIPPMENDDPLSSLIQSAVSNINGQPEEPMDPEDANLEAYVSDDTQCFMYSLIYSDLSMEYDAFPAFVIIDDEKIYGIGYADYEEGYKDSDGKIYFSAGFITFPNESVVTQEDIMSGLEIISINSYDQEFSYVYTYGTEDVHTHYVVDNKYVRCDIVDGSLQYNEEPYVQGMDVESSRGNIYNYDSREYVYIIDEQGYVPVSGVSLLGEATHKAIIDEVNEILKVQQINLSYQDLESYVDQSREALCSYLLGLQEEAFLGVSTAVLVDIVRQLDYMEHLRIGVDEDGATTVEIIEIIKLPTIFEKIAVSIVAAFAVVAGTILSMYGSPVLGGALIGPCLELFSQVVIENTPVSDVQWSRVAIACVSGAICGAINGAMSGMAAKGFAKVLLKETLDTVLDGLVGGAEFFVNSLIAGYSLEEAFEHFGYGVAAGVIISGGIKLLSYGAKGIARLIKKSANASISNVANKQIIKLGTDTAENGISELQEKLAIKSAKDGAQDALADTIDEPYSKSVKVSSVADAKTIEKLQDATEVLKRVDDAKKINKEVNKHLNPDRPPRANRIDSAFKNVDDKNSLAKLISEDVKTKQLYLKDFDDKCEGRLRYAFFVEDSDNLSGVLLRDKTQLTNNYRLIIEVFEDGHIEIYNAFPEFEYPDFMR